MEPCSEELPSGYVVEYMGGELDWCVLSDEKEPIYPEFLRTGLGTFEEAFQAAWNYHKGE